MAPWGVHRGAIKWRDFAAAAPELAAFLEQRLAATGILLLGTVRADGWARISPNEAYLVEGELLLGMMWRSRKAQDLMRDPRLTAATPQPDRHSKHGDLKLYGRGREITDPALREKFADAQEAAIRWRPREPFHLFALDIDSAGLISFGEGRRMLRWSPSGGVEERPHPEDHPPK